MAKYNIDPHPRILVVSPDDNFINITKLKRKYKSVKVIYDHQIGDVRLKEFDVVITNSIDGKYVRKLDLNLYVICIGGSEFPGAQIQEDQIIYPTKSGSSVSREFEVPDDLPGVLKKLTVSTVIPRLNELKSKPILNAFGTQSRIIPGIASIHPSIPVWIPTIKDGDGKVLVGYYNRQKNGLHETWYLPISTKPAHLYQWILTLFERWGTEDPEVFCISK